MHDRIRDALIATATAWALGIFVIFTTGSGRAGDWVVAAAWLPLFVICRLASGEYDRRTRNAEGRS